MKKNMAKFSGIVFMLTVFCFAVALEGADSKTLAFPGAEGFGAYTVGGRGGKVMFVTNLNDSGPGSFREACQAEGPRIVLFRVSGIIELKSGITIRNPYITIAGQTAPGDGICIKNWETVINSTHDVIIRYVRFRPNLMPNPRYDPADPDKRGSLQYEEFDALEVVNSQKIMIDHCSASWGNDETLTVTAAYGQLDKVTIQWTIISEGLDWYDHSMGSAMDAKDGGVSYHHNYFAHSSTRNPRVGGYSGYYINLDFRNNVLYNWGDWCGYGGGSTEGIININYVGNYFKPGPSTTGGTYSQTAFLSGSNQTYVYSDGNHMHGCSSCTDSSIISTGSYGGNIIDNPIAIPAWAAVTTDDVQTAYTNVLDDVGATLPRRDAVDTRIINDFINGTGGIIDEPNEVGGWPTYNSGTPYPDSDQDGMDDDWEVEHGLDPSNSDDHSLDRNGDGYTNLEEFLNYLVM